MTDYTYEIEYADLGNGGIGEDWSVYTVHGRDVGDNDVTVYCLAPSVFEAGAHFIKNVCGGYVDYVHERHFVAAFYNLSLHYGGPAEGGDYYEDGDMVAMVPCRTYGEVWAMRDRLKAMYGDSDYGRISWREYLSPQDVVTTYRTEPYYYQ